MIEYLVPAFNVVNMDLSHPYPRNLLRTLGYPGRQISWTLPLELGSPLVHLPLMA